VGFGWSVGELADCVPMVLAVARQAEALAQRVRAGAVVVSAAEDAGWRGPAAGSAVAAQEDVARRMLRCAAQLDDVAGIAVAHAHAAAGRVEQLEELARRAGELLDDVVGRS